VSSARAALTLAELGFSRVRPLRGGVSGWRERGHPLEPLRERWLDPAAAQVVVLPQSATGRSA
jgi:3-mercaptopyruvate sulfurtransferase SseA